MINNLYQIISCIFVIPCLIIAQYSFTPIDAFANTISYSSRNLDALNKKSLVCKDAIETFLLPSGFETICDRVKTNPANLCNTKIVLNSCPVTCKVCPCLDSLDAVWINESEKDRGCDFVAINQQYCTKTWVKEKCPVSCNNCCQDKKGIIPFLEGLECESFKKKEFKKYCTWERVRLSCPKSCETCEKATSVPSMKPSIKLIFKTNDVNILQPTDNNHITNDEISQIINFAPSIYPSNIITLINNEEDNNINRHINNKNEKSSGEIKQDSPTDAKTILTPQENNLRQPSTNPSIISLSTNTNDEPSTSR